MTEPAPLTSTEIRNLFDLTGRVAVITGAGGVLGGVLACGLALYGADVVVSDQELCSLDRVVADIRSIGRESFPVACDVTDEASVRTFMDEAVERMGRVDILVTAAGVVNRHPAEHYPPAEWDRVMAVNVRGTFLCCQAAGRHMIRQGRGKIITIGSVRGLVGSPGGNTGYSTSKAAVHLLTMQLATEWARYRINVNSIAPAVFRTPLTLDVLGNPVSAKWLLSRIPLGRIAEADDFIGTAVYLASSASDFVTGAIMSVDGGSAAG